MFKEIKNTLSYFYDLSTSEWHHKLFIYGLYTSYFLFFIALTGIISLSPAYLTSLEKWIKYYVCFIILIRFNPFIAEKHLKNNTDFDRRVAFSAGLFLLLSTSLVDIVQNYIGVHVPLIRKVTNSIKATTNN